MDAPSERPRSRTERFQLVVALFDELVACGPEERAARLARLGADEAELRDEVERMLAADARTSTPMTVGGGLEALERISSRGGVEGDAVASDDAPLPVLSGQYRIARRIGEGGMGVVYEAEQALPRRRVALKAVRAGFASRQVLRRFEQEAHILGRLHHPGIAQVYEAGLSRPERGDEAFLAMEFVDGAPLGEWAAGRTAREKVELVARVCDAVQHAHQRRVIHRDLKPANVLVDRSGQPKILDFGVARLADEDEAGLLRTRAGQLVGTLPYMSPEQVSGDPREVDARTDVYALGVILYELLSGRLPHPPAGRTLPEMSIAIRDEEPPRLGKLDRALRGDLEAIAAKALQKDRERRYQSALELASDLRRWLDGRPVGARGESGLYVLRRHVRRHRWLALASAVALGSLIAFAVTTKLAQQRAARDARELATVLRSSRIELGRLMALSGNLAGAEQLVWDAHLAGADEHSRWALFDTYSKFPCVRSFTGHTDSVLVMAMSPAGDLLATGSHDHTVRVWDWRSGECLAVHAFGNFIVGLAFTPDGGKLCAGDWNGTFACWDARTGAEVWRAEEPVLPRLMQFSVAADRALAACVGQGEHCALVDLDSGVVLARLPTPEPAQSCALSDDGAVLALGGVDGSLRLVATDSGRALRELTGHEHTIVCVRFLPDGAQLASGDAEGVMRIQALADGGVRQEFTSSIGAVRSISVTPDGARMLLCCASGVELWDPRSGSFFGERAQFRQTAFAAQFAPGEAQIVAGSVGGAIRVWEIDTPELLTTLPVRAERGKALALAPDAGSIARDAGDGHLELVDLAGGVLGRIPLAVEPLTSLSFDPTGARLAGFTARKHVSLWNVPDGAEPLHLDFDEEIKTLRFAPGGKLLAIEFQQGALRLLDARTGEAQLELAHEGGLAQRITFSPDGTRLASSHAKGRIELWELASGRLVRALESPRAVYSLCFDPSGELLYAGTWDGRVQLWECATGRMLWMREGHAQTIPAIVVSRDGRLAVTTGGDGLLRLWNRDTDACLLALDAGAGIVATFGLRADGRRLLAAYADGSLREWDLAYFDRHVAGNEAYQRSLRAVEAP